MLAARGGAFYTSSMFGCSAFAVRSFLMLIEFSFPACSPFVTMFPSATRQNHRPSRPRAAASPRVFAACHLGDHLFPFPRARSTSHLLPRREDGEGLSLR